MSDAVPSSDDLVRLLHEGHIEVEGRMPWSSNATFRVELCLDDTDGQAIYKPLRGERPLRDFPPGLHRREVATWVVSEALGWGLVPPTVLRLDAPYGEGSLQHYVDADFEEHYFTLQERPELQASLRAMCAFDIYVNNTDRKSGHCLLGRDGRIYGIDHGLCFSERPKLRTVIWDFAGEPIEQSLLDDIERIEPDIEDLLGELLDPEEIHALRQRGREMRHEGVFPFDHTGRRYPWPLV